MLQGRGGSSIYRTSSGFTQGERETMEQTVHIHVHVNGIVHGIGFTTWLAVHIYRFTYTQSFLFPHKVLLLHKVEKDGGKKYNFFKLQQLFPKYHCPNTSALRRRLAAALLGSGALRAAGRAQLPQGGVSVLDARAHPFRVQLT